MENYKKLRVNFQSDYEQFKNIKDRWEPSIFFPFSSGAGKPGVAASLLWDAIFGSYNKVVIGEMVNHKK